MGDERDAVPDVETFTVGVTGIPGYSQSPGLSRLPIKPPRRATVRSRREEESRRREDALLERGGELPVYPDLEFGDAQVWVDELAETQEVEEVKVVGYISEDVTEEAMSELFQRGRDPLPRDKITMMICSGCRKPTLIKDLTDKLVKFRPRSEGLGIPRAEGYKGGYRQRLVAAFCPTCLVQDLDYRRQPGKAQKGEVL